MAPSELSPEFPLPLELLCEIFKFLLPTDLQTLSLASRLTRSQAIYFIFEHLRYTGDILPKVRRINQARKDVKEFIRKLDLGSEDVTIGEDEGRLAIFQFLKTLPNLQVLNLGALVPPAYLSQFISSIRYTALLELVLHIDYAPVEGPPTAGLTGLEKLSIGWNASDKPNEPGSSLAHMYGLIQSTLTTLVNLTITIKIQELPGDFDLQLLKPAADTLRTFEYSLQSADESILDSIPAILPHLTKLSIQWCSSVLWKDAHIQALSKNNNLTDLTLSSDFEMNTQDTVRGNFASFVYRYQRRFKATQGIASACPRLQRCSWVRMRKDSSNKTQSFTVEERMTGDNVTRVVRGINWMGHSQEGCIVRERGETRIL